MRYRDTGTRLRGVAVAGDYGNPATIDWSEGSLDTVDYPCEQQPETGIASTSEDVDQQQRTLSRWVLFLPATADITAVDRWRFRGADYEISAVKPQRARGRGHHLEVRLLRVSGG